MDETGALVKRVTTREVLVDDRLPVLNNGWVYCDRIPQNSPPVNILDYYIQRYRHSDCTTWRTRIETGQILLNDQPTTPHTRVTAGDRLSYHRPPWSEPPVPTDVQVIHEDEQLLVINKPSGLPVLPGGNFLQHTLLWQLRQRYPTAVPIHRLGRGTSGLMLIAKTKLARAHLSQQLRQRRLNKIYRTLIGAADDLPDQFTITHPIGKLPYPRLGYLFGAVPSGMDARSDCSVICRELNATLLDVAILTGRPHQIRIHLAAAGYPLLGDPLYCPGGKPYPDGIAIPSDCGYWLHAYKLSFIHPAGDPLSVTCEPPSQLLP